ncbi:hypothetical protein O6H91_Y545300 [Diphasiastrum complanatum]|nr:hypothetical protein O6H91_Y545300 [Diphasiastrum complanatum]
MARNKKGSPRSPPPRTPVPMLLPPSLDSIAASCTPASTLDVVPASIASVPAPSLDSIAASGTTSTLDLPASIATSAAAPATDADVAADVATLPATQAALPDDSATSSEGAANSAASTPPTSSLPAPFLIPDIYTPTKSFEQYIITYIEQVTQESSSLRKEMGQLQATIQSLSAEREAMLARITALETAISKPGELQRWQYGRYILL